MLTDIVAADEASEETWDREEAFEELELGLDTGGLLLQQGGKLGDIEEFVVEEAILCGGFEAELEVLLLLLPVEAFTVESCN